MQNNILVHRPNELTKHWAQRILSCYSAEAKVSDVEILSVNTGTSTRLRVKVNHDAPGLVPESWFVKTPSLVYQSRLITSLPGLLQKEVHFYQSLSKTTQLMLPPVLAAQSRFGKGSTLVMSDLTVLGYRPGLPADTLSLEQARKVIAQLAKFHAQYWGAQNLLKQHRWLGGTSASVENQLGHLLAVPLMKRGLKFAGKLIDSKLHAPALRYAANRRKAMKFLAIDTQTVVHHDCHPGNLFWSANEPGFLDWQLVRLGEGIGDIAYFLATALQPDSRRKHEKLLLELYCSTLTKMGVPDVDAQKLFGRYQAHLTYAFEAMVITLALGNMMEHSSNLELIKRSSAAVFDHDSFNLLEI